MTVEIILAVLVVLTLIFWRLDHVQLTKWWDTHTTKTEREELGKFIALVEPLARDAVAYVVSVSPAASAAEVFIKGVERVTGIIEADYGPALKSLETLIENAVAGAVAQNSAKPPLIGASKTPVKVTPSATVS